MSNKTYRVTLALDVTAPDDNAAREAADALTVSDAAGDPVGADLVSIEDESWEEIDL